MIVSPERAVQPAQPGRDAVTLRLFGQVEVLDSGRTLQVGPPQRRAVLAAVAVDAGAPVPVELLVHRVWGGSPPDGARAAVHAHITRLRRVLAETRATQVRLGRSNHGYVLDIERDHVDLHRTQRLLDHAWEPGCDDARRVRLLREVLSIWRGPPLATVPGGWALRVRTGIETQLIGAAVVWAEAELKLGYADAVVDKLSQLASLYPFSEPLAAALMRALCAVGRRAEALQHYASTRLHLREELGAEPGLDLNRLHTAILRDELDGIGVDAAPSPIQVRSARPAPRHRPRQLPTAATGFTGRERELVAIENAFTAAGRDGSMALVAINGYGGVGKSALAIQAAHRLAGRFLEGQLYVDLDGGTRAAPLRPAEVLDRFLRALGVPDGDRPTEEEEAAALFRTLTADQRLLAVLDNARDLAQIRQLSPGAPGCGVLVTSRRILAGLEGVSHIHLDVLSESAAIEMLGRLVGSARVTAEPGAAAEVARWCGYLPLALRAAGARLAARPGWRIAALAHRLGNEQGRLDELDFAELSVRRSFAASYQELAQSADAADRSAASTFARLGSWGRLELSGADVARLLGRPIKDVEPQLERLVDARLLESTAPGWYQMPNLLRLYANEQPTAEIARLTTDAASGRWPSYVPSAPSS